MQSFFLTTDGSLCDSSVVMLFICAEGISQAGMLAFQFGAAREREKLAKRVSHRFFSFSSFCLIR